MPEQDTPSVDDAGAKVVPFKLALVENFTQDEPAEVPILEPAKAQMYLSIAAVTEMLMDNKDNLEYFVLAASIRDPDSDDDSMGRFTVATSPIKVADFCLALKMLDVSLTKNMTGG